jgi:hypothetical protein
MEKKDFENTHFSPLIYFVSIKERLSASCSYHGNVNSVGAPCSVHPAATDHEFVIRIMEGESEFAGSFVSAVLVLRAADKYRCSIRRRTACVFRMLT